jgi:hypothetical protein
VVVGLGIAVLQRIPNQLRATHHSRLPFQISRLAQPYDFMPLGNQPPRHMEELAGEVWVDEESFLHHGNCRQIEKYDLGGESIEPAK